MSTLIPAAATPPNLAAVPGVGVAAVRNSFAALHFDVITAPGSGILAVQAPGTAVAVRSGGTAESNCGAVAVPDVGVTAVLRSGAATVPSFGVATQRIVGTADAWNLGEVRL
ncbi:hypothetical protein [Nocardia macrotermitis]|uniref:Uncharacterized protein n=1 Tax=Nocardia macrotermitis TaxID=2585198 RepID=A0A7K0DD89_9NOCA|nr:hypothetical protein [Nocardia macrotermitis]MQY23760.1 hypothetical protein [Nocardia macrotermitis]